MDAEYQRRLIEDDYARLKERIAAEGWPVGVDLVDRTAFLTLQGARGVEEPYQVKIEPGQYPVGPWRVGFIDPGSTGDDRLIVPDRDARHWPFSPLPGLDGGFHVAYPGVYRVFYCQRCTTEFFYYHPDYPWQPHVYDLPRVVAQLQHDLQKAAHPAAWLPLFRAGGA